MTTTRDALLEQLIRDEWPRLRRFFHTKVPDSDVLDLVQATMLAFVDGRARATHGERAYLWGIARFQVLKFYDRQRPTTPFDSTVHTAMDVGRSLSSRLDGRNRLVRGLQALPTDHQIAFELRHGEGMSLEEVAAAIGVSLATVKRYLTAAREKLRRELSADADVVGAAYARL
ncbi:MAG: sigma-70 family RNA polymerase sigma factor [Myxococcota bacterium]|nr:sigma-70 family RNA polymerase sigma factor [Myxococcota bacterium]